MTSTAIGRVTAIYFLLRFNTEYGCCNDTATNAIHLIIISRTPMITRKMELPKPAVWNPITFPLQVLDNMKPYVLNPLPQIPYHNRPGQIRT